MTAPIDFAESAKHYTLSIRLSTDGFSFSVCGSSGDGGEVAGGSFETYGKLADYERRLPERFVRCHKSFLVNMDYVVACRSNELVLSTGQTVPVSQSRRKSTQEAVRAYVRDMR